MMSSTWLLICAKCHNVYLDETAEQSFGLMMDVVYCLVYCLDSILLQVG